MPTIRTVRPTDVVSLIDFLRNGSRREVTAQIWPEVWANSSTRVIWDILSRSVARPGRSQVWVCVAGGGLHGIAVARPRAGKLAWDVEELFVSEEDRAAGVELLEHLSVEATRNGARRVFLATPADREVSRIASRAGFVNYTSETLHIVRLAAPVAVGDLPSARPRLRQDTQGLFQLYNASVPCRVRSAEAMTLDEWSSLDRGSRLWAPSLGGSRQHYVWESQGAPIGWLKLTFGSKSQHMELLVHPAHHGKAEEMVLYSLGQVSHKVPIYFSVREYQAEIAAALERRGFARAADYLVFAREMTVRVPGRVLMPARA